MWWQPILAFVFITCIYFYCYEQLSFYPGYFVFMLVVQFGVNLAIAACPFNARNALAILCMTLLPWFLIFGVMLVCIHHIVPNIKYIFANVYGYMYVSSAAGKLLKENIKNKTDLSQKIYTDPSRFINYITTENFDETYEELVKETTVGDNFKTDLMKLVQSREMIGIAAWYLHTGILAICLVQNYMSTYACK